MNLETPDLILLRGAPASGKTSTSKCLAGFYPGGVRLEVDAIRAMVISVDWTRQDEHIAMLDLCSDLACGFLQRGFRPVLVVDTFSGDKAQRFIQALRSQNPAFRIQILGLFAGEAALAQRVAARGVDEFRDFGICRMINDQVRSNLYEGEIQIDTSSLAAEETARKLYVALQLTSPIQTVMP